MGPELPYYVYYHCSCEVEPGRVFIGGGFSGIGGDGDGAFIIDVDSGSLEALPDIPAVRDYGPACGVVKDGSGGYDIVVAGGGIFVVNIYNTRQGAWRPGIYCIERYLSCTTSANIFLNLGPAFPDNLVSYLAYLPYQDSFIFFGGYDYTYREGRVSTSIKHKNTVETNFACEITFMIYFRVKCISTMPKPRTGW